MEEFPKNTTPAVEREGNVDSLTDWREAKVLAVEEAKQRIEDIPGFATMSGGEQVFAIKALQAELSDDNADRHLDRAYATQIAEIMDVSDGERAAQGLPARSPYEQSLRSERSETAENATQFPAAEDSGYAPVLGYTHEVIPKEQQIAVDEQQELSPAQQKAAANDNRSPQAAAA